MAKPVTKYKFSSNLHAEYTATLKRRVSAYFDENDIKITANGEMIFKTIVVLSIYIAPFFVILFSGITNLVVLFALWGIMGLGKSFIGTSVMHDSLHGSYSKSKWVNSIIGLSTAILGADPKIWKIQHNVLHHTYTNIADADEDIAPRFVLRFSPNQPLRWFHKYQHIYALFFYSISTLTWVTIKDFIKIFHYNKRGFIKSGRELNTHFAIMTFRKAVYYIVLIGGPIYFLDLPVWLTVSMFVFMHAIAGASLSLVFQTAHVMPDTLFIKQEEEKINQNWLVHQLYTTTNFAPKNGILSWFIGGLNRQIEHHLFPNICHVHYPKITGIVKQTTKEFGLPYLEERTFTSAVASHIRMLKRMGRGEEQLVPVNA
ncbi:MAG: acyl-CoA desaturase [Cyclobacteriaceae bacterium]